jgi:hypothetical protein
MIRNNQSLQRQTFDMLQKKYAGKEVSPHFLRCEVTLKNGVNKYKFDHRTVGSESSTERKLDRNDLVYVTSIMLGWLECKEGEEATAPIHTYANASFPNVEAVYNGFLSLKTGSKVNFEAMPCLDFKYVPQTQGNATAGTLDQFNVMDAARSGVEDLYLHGTKSHELTVEFPTTGSMTLESTTAGTVRKLVLMLNGFIIKNGADALGK